MSTQNKKDIFSKIFGMTHNVGAGGACRSGGSMIIIPKGRRFEQRYDRLRAIFNNQPAIKNSNKKVKL